METALNYLDDKVMFVSTDEQKMKTRLSKLASQYPQECVITVRPEDNDGCMNAKLPAGWLKIYPPPKREYTEEQKEALRKRAQKMFAVRKQKEGR